VRIFGAGIYISHGAGFCERIIPSNISHGADIFERIILRAILCWVEATLRDFARK
jgi:hypothetical protein